MMREQPLPHIHHYTLKYPMKTTILFLALFFSFVTANASSCDKCGKRTIAFYDAAVLIPRPTGTDSVLKYWVPRWWRLFSITIPARSALRTSDPTFDCIIAYDGALLSSAGAFRDTLIGVEHANVAPAGPLSSADYIFTGSSYGTFTNISLNLRIEASRTRELVLSGTMSFDDLINASDIAQQLALGSLSPIAQKILDWEKKKRDTDPEVTINGEEIIVTPVKKSIKTNETILVRFEYKDCDGVPLKGRKLYFNGVMVNGMSTGASTLGRFEKDSILTDENGRAEQTFIPSGVKGMATLVVCNVYKFPFGATGAADGHATVFIDTPPVVVWKISGSVSTLQRTIRNDAVSGMGASMTHNESDNSTGTAKYSLLVIDGTNRPGEFHFGDGESQLLSQMVRGSYNEVDNLAHEEKGPKGLSYAEYRYDQYSGSPVTSDFSVVARFEGGSSMVSIDAPFFRDGIYGAREWIQQENGQYGWSEWSDDMHDQVSGAWAEWFEGDAAGVFKKTDSGFVASGHKTTVTNRPAEGQVNTLDETFSLVVSPSSSVTNVSPHEQKSMLSTTPVLYPNYPNPFNPSTTIRFFVPTRSKVRLEIFNVLGQNILTLVDDVREAGIYWQTWNAAVCSGIYCCRLTSESLRDHHVSSFIQSMLLVR